MYTIMDAVKKFSETIGSKAKTNKGRIKAAIVGLKNPLLARRWKSASKVYGNKPRKAPKPFEAFMKHAQNDPRFRKELVAKIKRMVQKIESQGFETFDRFPKKELDLDQFKFSQTITTNREALKRLESLLIRLSPRTKLKSRFSLLKLSDELARHLGFNRQARLSNWEPSYHHSVQIGNHITQWKNGRPRTLESASRHTRILSVIQRNKHDITIYLKGTKRTHCLNLPCKPEDVTTDGALGHEIGIKHRTFTQFYDLKGNPKYIAIPMPLELRARFGNYEHGQSIRECLEEIARKRNVLGTSYTQNRKAYLYARTAKLTVDFATARALGACRSGIENWCLSRNVSLKDSIPVTDLIQDDNTFAKRIGWAVARKALDSAISEKLSKKR